MYNFSVPDLENIYIPDSATGMFTGGPLGAPVSVSGIVPPPVVAPSSQARPAMLGNTNYSIRATPQEALSGLSGLPVSLPPAVIAFMTGQGHIVSPFQGMPSLAGATNIFGDRTYTVHSQSGPQRLRVGGMEMRQLNQAPGYNTTVRPEFLGEMYLPFRPEGNDPNILNDIKLWHQYYTDNKDYRKYLSADEQTELAWLDYRTGFTDKNQFTSAVNQVRENFNLPQKVGFKDFEAHFSEGIKQKRQTDNPYADLLAHGAGIGGYWNPENDPSEFQQVMSNPVVNAALTAVGSYFGGPWGAALASGLTTRASGADWNDALTAAAISGGTAYLGGKLAGPSSAPVGEFNIPGVNLGAAPVSQFNRELITNSLLSPTAASAIANPALNLAAPSFFSTALGQGLGKAGLALASGGDIKDALTAGVLGYSGTPGGLLSGTLGSAGANFGTSQIGQALNNLSVADALKFGIKLPEEQWSAVGSLFGDLDLGSISEYGAFNALPSALQTALSNVKLSDVLENVGGVDYGSLLNIAYDVKLPGMESGLFSGLGLNLPNAPEWLKGIYGSAQDIFQNLPDINFPNMNISDFNIPNIDFSNLNVPDINFPNLDVPNINVPDFNVSNINTPNFNVPNINIPNFNVPNVNTNNLDVSNVNTPNLDLLSSSLPSTVQQGISGFGGLFGGGGEGAEAEPFMAKVVYDPRLQQLTPIAYSDPLSILLAEFYRTKRQA